MIDPETGSEAISSRAALTILTRNIGSREIARYEHISQIARARVATPLQDRAADERECQELLRRLVEALIPAWAESDDLTERESEAIYEAVGHRDRIAEEARAEAAAARPGRPARLSSGARHVRRQRRAAERLVAQATAMATTAGGVA